MHHKKTKKTIAGRHGAGAVNKQNKHTFHSGFHPSINMKGKGNNYDRINK